MSKVISVIALLDDVSTQRLTALRRKLKIIEGSYNNKLPHITISVYDKNIDLDELMKWTKKIADNHRKFKIKYKAVGIIFGNCLIAIPSFSAQLYTLYYNHHQKFDDLCRDYNALKNGDWLPHTGIWYTDNKTACENIGKLTETFKLFEAEIISLRITEYDYNVFTDVVQFDLQ